MMPSLQSQEIKVKKTNRTHSKLKNFLNEVMADINMDEQEYDDDDDEEMLQSMEKSIDQCVSKRISMRNMLTAFTFTDTNLDSEFIDGRCNDVHNEFAEISELRHRLQKKGKQQRCDKIPEDNFPDFKAAGFALVLGANEYEYLENLQTPEADAHLLKERFQEQQYLVQTITNSNVTRENILQKLKEASELKVAPHASFIFHFSGHGKKNRICMPNYNPKNKDSTSILNTELLRAIPRNFSKVLIILDCCHSGAIRSLQNNFELLSTIPMHQTIHVVCSTNSEISIEDNFNGLFSSSLARALRNTSLCQYALDRKIAFQNLFKDICRDVIHTSACSVGYLQHPQLFTLTNPWCDQSLIRCRDFYFQSFDQGYIHTKNQNGQTDPLYSNDRLTCSYA